MREVRTRHSKFAEFGILMLWDWEEKKKTGNKKNIYIFAVFIVNIGKANKNMQFFF